nr:MAG TPA: cortexin-like protein [Caudoviricetes sp.]
MDFIKKVKNQNFLEKIGNGNFRVIFSLILRCFRVVF